MFQNNLAAGTGLRDFLDKEGSIMTSGQLQSVSVLINSVLLVLITFCVEHKQCQPKCPEAHTALHVIGEKFISW